MTRLEESLDKIRRIRNDLLTEDICGILICGQPNFSYLTAGGRGFLGLASVNACGSLFITKQNVYLLSNNIESGRLLQEELPQDLCDARVLPWWDETSSMEELERLAGGSCLTDQDSRVAGWMKRARSRLNAAEQERYRELCSQAAGALEGVLREAPAGISEFEAAGRISKALWELGAEPVSLFAAADDRIHHARHFIPTKKCAEHSITASICARRHGLVASVTRTVYFTAPPEQAVTAYQGLLAIEGEVWDAMLPGADQSELFPLLKEAYRKNGMEGEWKNHHQGGLTGYLPREEKIDSHTQGMIEEGNAFALNPSCTWAKSEDTVLVESGGVEILSTVGNWPVLSVRGRTRPGILVRK